MSFTQHETPLALLRHRIRALGLTQEAIAELLGVSQSQVSRVLSGQSTTRSKLFQHICIYVQNAETGLSKDNVRNNEALVAALAEVWDGTPGHAEALSTIIRSLALLGPHLISAKGNQNDYSRRSAKRIREGL